MDKLHIINKQKGTGSTDVLNYIKREYKKITSQKLKIGHGGTLDPFAHGVLVVGIGTGTKQLGNFLSCSKVYEAEIYFGHVTDTQDCEGKKTFISDCVPTEQKIRECLNSFIGKIEQTPPKYSAIHIGGKRAYDLAREGKDFEIPKRTVNVEQIEFLEYSYPILKIKTKVSGGTYIRTLAFDIGNALGCGAFLNNLCRTKVNEFTIENTVTKEELVAILTSK
jgi:tRNA pseudouridine55 synthase